MTIRGFRRPEGPRPAGVGRKPTVAADARPSLGVVGIILVNGGRTDSGVAGGLSAGDGGRAVLWATATTLAGRGVPPWLMAGGAVVWPEGGSAVLWLTGGRPVARPKWTKGVGRPAFASPPVSSRPNVDGVARRLLMGEMVGAAKVDGRLAVGVGVVNSGDGVVMSSKTRAAWWNGD